jgi:hypothetical protein
MGCVFLGGYEIGWESRLSTESNENSVNQKKLLQRSRALVLLPVDI